LPIGGVLTTTDPPFGTPLGKDMDLDFRFRLLQSLQDGLK